MEGMTFAPKPRPPEADWIPLVTEIRSLQPAIDKALADLEVLYDQRALLVKRLYDHGLRYVDLQRVLPINGGSVFAALKRAGKLTTGPVDQPADACEFTNERTLSVTGPPDLT